MAMINIRIDDALKADVDTVFKELNMSATEAITKLYRYTSEYRKLPFDDPRKVLFQMRNAIDKASDIATKLNIEHKRKGFISVAERDVARDIFDGTARSVEANYSALQSACGGYLQLAWLNAVNAMKGLLWMLSMCAEDVSEGVYINAELDKATKALSSSFTEISLITEQFY